MTIRIILAVMFAATSCLVTGCDKKDDLNTEVEVKTTEEYKAEADKEITAENADDELAAIEKAMEDEKE